MLDPFFSQCPICGGFVTIEIDDEGYFKTGCQKDSKCPFNIHSEYNHKYKSENEAWREWERKVRSY